MKAVTMYEADDGSRWNTPDKALDRDALIARCKSIEEGIGLRPVPRDTGFATGDGYVQQPEGAKAALIRVLKGLGANRDSDGPIGKLLHRAWCMDAQDREWGQPYYALHPLKGKQVELVAGGGS